MCIFFFSIISDLGFGLLCKMGMNLNYLDVGIGLLCKMCMSWNYLDVYYLKVWDFFFFEKWIKWFMVCALASFLGL